MPEANNHDETAIFIEKSVQTTDPAPQLPQLPGYEILEVLGRGGMGVVYKAMHQALKRLVAIKMIRTPGQATIEDLSRFRIEAEAIARLHHPNIVQIYDVGDHMGLPYLALEYLRGGTLDDCLSGQPVPFRQAAEMVETLARTVHYAHEQGIVHRDLKPGNILLDAKEFPDAASEADDYDASNTTQPFAVGMKITDFGLAKFFASQDAGQTETGSILGTPSYMAPEQATGSNIGPRTDVYALGAILYEMLTGRPPFRAATAWDTVQQVVTEDPIPPRRLQTKLPLDLDTICLKCLAKSPPQRYPTASALADDLRRFLENEPILARPVGPSERLLKWAKRRPSRAALVAVCCLGTLVLIAGWLRYSLDLSKANTQIRNERDNAVKAEDAAKKQFDRARKNLFALQLSFVGAIHEADPSRALALLEEKERCPEDLRDLSWSLLHQICQRFSTLTGHGNATRTLVYAKDGAWLASGSYDGTVKIWNVGEGRARSTIPIHRGTVMALALLDQKQVLLAGMEDGVVQPLSVVDGRLLEAVQGHSTKITALATNHDGTRIASASADGKILIRRGLDDQTPEILPKRYEGVQSLAFSPDGKQLAIGSTIGITLWDLGAGRSVPGPAPEPGMDNVMSIAYSNDGKHLACCSFMGLMQWWDAKDMKQKGRLKLPTIFWSVGFSPDGRSIAVAMTSGTSGVVRVLDVETARETMRFTGVGKIPWSLKFAPDGKTIAVGSETGAVGLCSTAPKLDGLVLSPKDTIASVAFSPDSRHLLSGSDNGCLTLWDCASAEVLKSWNIPRSSIAKLAYVPGRNVAAVVSQEGLISILNLEQGSEPARFAVHQGGIIALSFSPDGKMLTTCGLDGTVRVWDWVAGSMLAMHKFGERPVWCASHSPDGKTLVLGDSAGVVHLCDPLTLVPRSTLPKRDGAIFSVVFQNNGSTLSVAGTDSLIELWDWPNETKRLTLMGHPAAVLTQAFPPDGHTLASAGGDNYVRLWDLLSGQVRLRIPHSGANVSQLTFAPDGKTLAVVSASKIMLWKSNLAELPLGNHASTRE